MRVRGAALQRRAGAQSVAPGSWRLRGLASAGPSIYPARGGEDRLPIAGLARVRAQAHGSHGLCRAQAGGMGASPGGASSQATPGAGQSTWFRLQARLPRLGLGRGSGARLGW